MRILIIAAVIFWLIVGFAFGQTAPKSEYEIRVKTNHLVVKYQKKSHDLKLLDEIGARRIEDAKILFAKRSGDFTYLVVDVSGMSKEKPDDRMCGAGVEANLLWLKLDDRWEIKAVDSILYESCWVTVMADEGYKISGNTLSIHFENFRDDLITDLTYDNDRPEKGFAKKTAALNVDK